MRISNSKIIIDQIKFNKLFPKYKSTLNELISKYSISDGNTFEKHVNFKTNKITPKHNWYEYKQGYSELLIKQIIDLEKPSKYHYILDPFCGVGTTNLSVQTIGYKSIGFDINPVAILSTEIKTHYFTEKEMKLIRTEIDNFKLPKNYEKIIDSKVVLTSFQPKTLSILLKIKYYIDNLLNVTVQKFFRLAFLSIIDDCSLKIKDGNGLKLRKKYTPLPDIVNHYLDKCNKMYSDILKTNYSTKCIHILGSMINDGHFNKIKDKKIGLCIFSPPYANCFDYCEVYKLEFWLGGFVKKYKDFQYYRNLALRSHVNSKFDHNIKNYIKNAALISDLLSTFNLWNKNIPSMICGYFDDMFELLKKLKQVLLINSKCYIIVANSGYKGILVPTDLLIADIADTLGYKVNNIFHARNIRSSSQQMQFLNDSYDNMMRESVVEIQYKDKKK